MKRLAIVLAIAGCAGKTPPPTRYYQLAAPAPAAKASGQGMLVVEPLHTDGAYDDERMVYRLDPYRLDYYDYHRWTAAPGTLVADYLEQALRDSGRFRVVSGERASDTSALVLGGRLLALEEIDRSKTQWLGHVRLELVARDGDGNIVWTKDFDETAAMPVQSPEGLARAITDVMARIAARVAPELGTLCDRESRSARSGDGLARTAQ